MNNDRALVVFSGGQDSTTCLYLAKQQHKEVLAVCFNYGQAHSIELEAASRIAAMAGVKLIEKNCKGLLESTSPLVDWEEPLEVYTDFVQMEETIGNRVEKTFVPMRNALFLTIAANLAVKYRCGRVVTGICDADGANYPDCTEYFRNSIERSINHALFPTPQLYELGRMTPKLRIQAPLIDKSKAETVRLARSMEDCWIALAWSHTSYDGLYPPMGMNHSNVLRAHGFEEAGLPDPLVIRAVAQGLMPMPTTKNYSDHKEIQFILDRL